MDQDCCRRFRLLCGRDSDEPRGRRLPVIRSSIKLALGPAVLAARLLVSATGKFSPGLFGCTRKHLGLAHGSLGTQQLL